MTDRTDLADRLDAAIGGAPEPFPPARTTALLAAGRRARTRRRAALGASALGVGVLVAAGVALGRRATTGPGSSRRWPRTRRPVPAYPAPVRPRDRTEPVPGPRRAAARRARGADARRRAGRPGRRRGPPARRPTRSARRPATRSASRSATAPRRTGTCSTPTAAPAPAAAPTRRGARFPTLRGLARRPGRDADGRPTLALVRFTADGRLAPLDGVRSSGSARASDLGNDFAGPEPPPRWPRSAGTGGTWFVPARRLPGSQPSTSRPRRRSSGPTLDDFLALRPRPVLRDRRGPAMRAGARRGVRRVRAAPARPTCAGSPTPSAATGTAPTTCSRPRWSSCTSPGRGCSGTAARRPTCAGSWCAPTSTSTVGRGAANGPVSTAHDRGRPRSGSRRRGALGALRRPPAAAARCSARWCCCGTGSAVGRRDRPRARHRRGHGQEPRVAAGSRRCRRRWPSRCSHAHRAQPLALSRARRRRRTGRRTSRTQLCIAIAAAARALIERVEPNCAIENVPSHAAARPRRDPGPPGRRGSRPAAAAPSSRGAASRAGCRCRAADRSSGARGGTPRASAALGWCRTCW